MGSQIETNKIPSFKDSESFALYNCDCLAKMRELPDNSIDAVVTDPPYGLSFMGKDWDIGVPGIAFWRETLRIAKPGAHLLAFGGTRTYHRLACAIEDAGWEIRDCIMWVYASGWPKSMDIAKAIRKQSPQVPSSAGDKWSGWGTALKPALEPIVVARKPIEGTITANVLKYGTGGINIDACRVPLAADDKLQDGVHHDGNALDTHKMGWRFKNVDRALGFGRFPANLIHDGSDEVLSFFPESKGQCGAIKGTEPSALTCGIYGKFDESRNPAAPRGDSGSAARFFYCAKASRSERGEGNDHTTVKPLALMRYLITLVCPQGATVLDPFMGSGTTGVAAIQLSRKFIGIEKESHYCDIAQMRIAKAKPLNKPVQLELEM